MLRDEEPTYFYVKGQGWVPNSVNTLVFDWGEFRITLMERKPNPGEYAFAEVEGTTLETTKDNLLSQQWRLNRLHRGEPISLDYDNLRDGYWGNLLDNHTGVWVTVHHERIDG